MYVACSVHQLSFVYNVRISIHRRQTTKELFEWIHTYAEKELHESNIMT